jgi:hypothetical protein
MMAAFTAVATLAASIGLIVGGISAFVRADRPPPAGCLVVSLGSMIGGLALLGLFFLVISHG